MLEDREKKLVYIAVGIIVVLILIIIVIIWSPMFTSDEKEVELASVNEYENGYYLSTMQESYKTVVSNVVDKDNFESTYDLLDQDYLDEMSMTKEELEEYLTSNNILTYTTTTAVVYCDKVITDNEIYVYSYVYKVGNVERKVHIIEDYYGSYTISFLQDSYPIIDTTEYDVIDSTTGLEFKVEAIDSYSENIVYNVTIINNTTEEYTFDFSNINNSKVGYYVSNVSDTATLSSVIVGTQSSQINSTPGSTNSIKLSYLVSVENQTSVGCVYFYNVVKSNGDTINVTILLN